MVPNLSPKCKLLLPYRSPIYVHPIAFYSWSILYLHVLLRRVNTSQKVVFYVTAGKWPDGNLTGGGSAGLEAAYQYHTEQISCKFNSLFIPFPPIIFTESSCVKWRSVFWPYFLKPHLCYPTTCQNLCLECLNCWNNKIVTSAQGTDTVVSGNCTYSDKGGCCICHV